MSYKDFAHWAIGKILRIITSDNAVRKIRSGVLKGEKWIVGSGSYDFWMGAYEKEIAEKFEKYAKKVKLSTILVHMLVIILF